MYGNNFVAFLTAFDDDGSVKLSACEKMVDFYVGQGADGLYLHGYTGEGWCMTPDMRKEWMKRTVEVSNHRIPVYVSVGYGKTQEEGIELARYAGAVGADAVSSIAISKTATIEENVAYFKKISEASNLPFYIYWNVDYGNLNGGARLDAEDMIDILKREVPTFAGFKFTDSNLYYAQRIKQYAPDVVLLSGIDTMCVAARLMGFDGSIGALQAATCGHFSSMLKLMNEGRLDDALGMQLHVNNIFAAIDEPEVGSLVAGIKYIMNNYYKVDVGHVSAKAPYRDITDKDIARRLMERFESNIGRI